MLERVPPHPFRPMDLSKKTLWFNKRLLRQVYRNISPRPSFM